MAKKTLKDLRSDHVDAKPVNVDGWQLGDDVDAPLFECWESCECEDCGASVVIHNCGGGEKHRDLDPDSKCTGYVGYSEGPMMNYWYPCEWYRQYRDPDEAARAISDLPLCLVRVNGQDGLALTGGGMDLAWEICAAYTRLGFLPPSHFTLPRMGGKEGKGWQFTWSACMKSAKIQVEWAKAHVREMRVLHDWMRDEGKKREAAQSAEVRP